MGGCVCMCACAYAVLHGDCYSFLLTAHYYSPLTEKALKSDWAPFSKAEDWRPERVAVADGARRTPAPSLVQLSILQAQDMLPEAAMPGAAEIEKRYASAAKRSRLVSVRTAHNIPVASAVPATPVAASPAAAAPPDPVSSIALRPIPSPLPLPHFHSLTYDSLFYSERGPQARAIGASCAVRLLRPDRAPSRPSRPGGRYPLHNMAVTLAM